MLQREIQSPVALPFRCMFALLFFFKYSPIFVRKIGGHLSGKRTFRKSRCLRCGRIWISIYSNGSNQKQRFRRCSWRIHEVAILIFCMPALWGTREVIPSQLPALAPQSFTECILKATNAFFLTFLISGREGNESDRTDRRGANYFLQPRQK